MIFDRLLVVPSALLVFLWRGKMTKSFTINDLPIFIVPTVLHVSDILFSVIGGFNEILWLVLLASFAQTALLLFAYLNNRLLMPQPLPVNSGR